VRQSHAAHQRQVALRQEHGADAAEGAGTGGAGAYATVVVVVVLVLVLLPLLPLKMLILPGRCRRSCAR